MFSLQKFFGKDDQFLDLLEASAEECIVSVNALKHILTPGAKLSLEEFVVSRRRDKQITNDIRELLCKTSVTGLEPEDIESITNSLYKIPKTIEKFAERYILFADHLQDVKWDEQTKLLEQATKTVLEMVQELRAKSHLEKLKEQNDILQKVEGDADDLILHRLKELYSDQSQPVKIIILKDLYELLEKVVDRCRDAGNVISNIILKNY
jgi:hypothetical protein